MIDVVLTWWKEQLLSLVPGRAGARPADAVVVTLRGADHLDATLRLAGRTLPLGAFTLDRPGAAALAAAVGDRRRPVELALPPGLLLEQRVTLPLAVERDPAAVLRYEMDRLTPFTANELYWGWALERRLRAQSQLHIRLWLVLRAQVDPALDALRAAGLRPVAIAAPGRRIALGDPAAATRERRLAAGLAVACGVLALAAAALPFVQQARADHALARRIESLRPAVDRAEALRRKLASASAAVDVLASERAKTGDPLAILAALTDILPDDTVLTELSLRQRVIAITGQSGAAARLIPALAADPALRDPVFTAPVTRNDTTHREGFSIRAVAAPPAEAAALTRDATR